eukprot:TRINITY_DN110_c0_g4_i1.p1 TRINITY_DN110_c0_g4~~TRINITY_DN110_c0_g4_i1.p1  ORF type:complete len:293 (+),score=75.62 TRINITY_DN110_c0_g4_i1:213-1091(+)
MGCIFSSSGGDSSNKSKKEFSLTTSDGKHKTSAWSTEFDEQNWKQDTEKIWQRKIEDLSIHMDLPRLGHKISIYKNGSIIEENNNNNNSTKSEVVFFLCTTLVEQLGESEEFISEITDNFYHDDYVHKDGSGDVSQQLLRFLVAMIHPESKTERVLKLCHQKMVFPAFYSIKNKIFDELPFKDQRGTWFINIYINDDDDTVTVVHSKRQIAKNTEYGQEEEFSFRWELICHLVGDTLEELEDQEIRIAEVKIREDVSKSRKKEINQLFEKNFNMGSYQDVNEDESENETEDE